jgi:hypothetical protein
VHIAFSQPHVGRYCKIPRQTEGHSLGNISKAVGVPPSCVTEALYSDLFCISMTPVTQFRTKSFHL